jgi:hypothetical protein
MTFGSGPLVLGPDVADWQTVAVVAQPSQPNDPGGRGEDFGKSSPVGLLVLLLFFIAVGGFRGAAFGVLDGILGRRIRRGEEVATRSSRPRRR